MNSQPHQIDEEDQKKKKKIIRDNVVYTYKTLYNTGIVEETRQQNN